MQYGGVGRHCVYRPTQVHNTGAPAPGYRTGRRAARSPCALAPRQIVGLPPLLVVHGSGLSGADVAPCCRCRLRFIRKLSSSLCRTLRERSSVAGSAGSGETAGRALPRSYSRRLSLGSSAGDSVGGAPPAPASDSLLTVNAGDASPFGRRNRPALPARRRPPSIRRRPRLFRSVGPSGSRTTATSSSPCAIPRR